MFVIEQYLYSLISEHIAISNTHNSINWENSINIFVISFSLHQFKFNLISKDV